MVESDSGAVDEEDVSDDITQLGLCHQPVSQEPWRGAGYIDGVPYTAASTCGDGACSLHMLFGRPSEDGDQLFMKDVREKVLSILPADVSSALGSFSLLRGTLLVDVLEKNI